jgi:hypothetical protein
MTELKNIIELLPERVALQFNMELIEWGDR